MMTIGYRYPELTPWIEDIMSKATDKFKSDPYVKDYYQKALENQAIMNGMKEVNNAPAVLLPFLRCPTDRRRTSWHSPLPANSIR